METRRLGASGLAVSRLGLGTLGWGTETPRGEAAASLAAFREAGGTLLETADAHDDGAAESLLGELVAGIPRHEVVLATQAGAPTGLGAGGSRRHLLAALDASLARLGTDHVDLWQVAGWDPVVPLGETLAALDTAVTSGRARYVGIAEVAAWQLATAAAHQGGGVPLVATEVPFSLLDRAAEDGLLAAAAHHGVGVLARSALGGGVLTGKYRRGVPGDSRAASPRRRELVERHLDERGARIVEAVSTAADGLGVSPLAVALAWVRDHDGITAAVVGARTAAQLTGALEAERLELPGGIRAALDDAGG